MSDEEEVHKSSRILQDPKTLAPLFTYVAAPESTTVWSWYEVITEWGIDQAHRMAILSAEVVAGKLSETDQAKLRKMLESIKWACDFSKDRRQEALSNSYDMLRRGEWTRSKAAEHAEWMLGKAIDPEAWRKAVNKWADENGKPRLDLPHGRPSKKNRNID